MHGEGQAVRGAIGARPWGTILGGIGVAARSVQLTLRSEDKVYRIAFDRGLVVAATSPVAADAVTRIALANHFIVSTQVDDIKRKIATAPNLDDVDVLAATAKLDPEATRTLRNRVILQRAARTFVLDQGEYEIEDRMPISIAGTGIDIRGVIFLGARMNLSEERLRAYLRELSARFVLKPGVFEDLERYGFTAAEQPVLEALRAPTSLAELEASHRDIDPRGIQAVVYALGSCNALAEIALAASEPVVTFPDQARVEALMKDKSQTIPPTTARAPTVQITERVRSSTRIPKVERDELPPERVHSATLTPPTARQTRSSIPPVTESPRRTRTSVPPVTESSRQTRTSVPPVTESSRQTRTSVPPVTESPKPTRTPSTTRSPKPSRDESAEISLRELSVAEGTPSVEPPSRMLPPEAKRVEVEALSLALASFELDQPELPRKVTSVLKRNEVIDLIHERTALLASGADHFTLLGVPLGAAIEDVNAAYLELSRHLKPEHLAELGIRDEAFTAESLLTQLRLAFTVLTDRVRRSIYIDLLKQRKPR